MAGLEVIGESVVFVDADGAVTDELVNAVRGEIVQTLADGSTRSTLFTLDGGDHDHGADLDEDSHALLTALHHIDGERAGEPAPDGGAA